MDGSLLLRHLTTSPRAARRLFSEACLAKIEEAIHRSEQRHLGQIVFVVESTLSPLQVWRGATAKTRARAMFLDSGCWDTEHNNGVLIYLLVAERDFEIVADRGIHAHVSDEGWEAICRQMEQAFRDGRFLDGVLQGIAAVSQHLEAHFPRTSAPSANEVSDKPIIL
ncbi:MAG: TPM domain-containing protein [Pseudomonadota bacterium]